LPPQSEPPAPSLVHQKDPSQLSGDQPPSSQTPRDSSSSTGLPPTLKSDNQGSYSPPQLSPSDHNVESRSTNYTSKPGSKVRGKKITSKTKATPVSTDAEPDSYREPTQSTNRPPKPTIKTRPGARVGMDGRTLAEGILETDVELSDQHQQLAVMTGLTPMQDPRSHPLPSRPTSRNPSRRPHQKAYFPAPTGSLYQGQASPSLLDHNTAPQHSRVSHSERAEYHPNSPPDWYIAPNAQESELGANGATRHTTQQPGGQYYRSDSHVTLAPSHETAPSVADQIARFDQGSLGPPGPLSHTHRWLSKPFQQIWTGAPTSQPGPNGIPFEIPPGPYLKRSVSRRGDRRPISTAGSAHGAPRMPLVSRGTQSVNEQRSNVERPHSKQYRPASDSERSLHSAMGRHPQAHSMPSIHARDRPLPSKRGVIPQGRTSVGSSKRPGAKMVTTDDPLTAHGSGSSSSASSAALEKYEPESEPKKHRLPHPGTVDTRVPKSRKESISRGSPPSIYVVPADTPSPPPPSLGVTNVHPPTSMVDSRSTLRPATGTSKATSRSAPKESHEDQSRQYVPSGQSEGIYRRSNKPSQNRHDSPARLDPNHRGLGRSLERSDVPRGRSALPGLSRIGSSGSLREQAQAAELSSEVEDSQGTSGYFTENDDDRTSNYSDDNDGSLDERTRGPSSVQRSQIPQNARGDPRSRQARHVEDDRPRVASNRLARPAPRLGVETREPSPRPPPQQRPVDGVPTSENGHVERGRRRSRSRSRSRMPGGFPGELERSTRLTM
jgi:hypothetical protein